MSSNNGSNQNGFYIGTSQRKMMFTSSLKNQIPSTPCQKTMFILIEPIFDMYGTVPIKNCQVVMQNRLSSVGFFLHNLQSQFLLW